jgi:D-alanine-D-alanine ligase
MNASQGTRSGQRVPADQPVAVLMGGPSAEHDVSLVSGRAIAGALAGQGLRVEGWLIGLDSTWWRLPSVALDTELPQVAYDTPTSLGAEGPLTAAAALERIAASTPRPVVFPALHGPFGEDGTVQSLLASADLVTCGSGPAASALGMDKVLFKRICGAMELPVLPWVEVSAASWAQDQRSLTADLEAFATELPDPRLVVKPRSLGSSIGVSIVHRPDEPPELEHAVTNALRYDSVAFAEPYLEHARELEAAVVGNTRDDLEVFGPGEILPSREFYDFVDKYQAGTARTTTSPDLDAQVREDIRRISAEVFLAIGARGFARVDFLLASDDFLVVSEINTIPGFTPISLFPMLCAEGGYGFGDICARIVELALEEAASRPARQLTRADLP